MDWNIKMCDCCCEPDTSFRISRDCCVATSTDLRIPSVPTLPTTGNAGDLIYYNGVIYYFSRVTNGWLPVAIGSGSNTPAVTNVDNIGTAPGSLNVFKQYDPLQPTEKVAQLRRIAPGPGITVTYASDSIVIGSAGGVVDLTDGGIAGGHISLVATTSLTPALQNKGLVAGANIVLTTTGTDVTISAPSAGVAYSLYGRFYGLTAGTGNGGPTDYAATVAVKTGAGTGRVPFPRNGPASGLARIDASSFTLPAIGTYLVTFNVHTTEPGQLQLELQGADLPDCVGMNMNPTSGGHPITCTAFVTTAVVNSVLAVVNCSGNSTALTITPADGANTHANTQAITIARIA